MAFFYSIRAGVWGSQSVLLAKALSMLLSQLLHPQNDLIQNPLKTYETYFILLGFVAAATFWMLRLNNALKLFEAVYMIPMMQLSWMFFSSLSGGIYYEEFVSWSWQRYVLYSLSFSLILLGVFLLCPQVPGREHATSLAEAVYEIVETEMSEAVDIAGIDELSDITSTGSHDGARLGDSESDRDEAIYVDLHHKRSISPAIQVADITSVVHPPDFNGSLR
eukprot:CAMPEP_0182450266 /NCGR_PEP_ID=MMETSP1172-20130603/40107_1 /TAXON_ID=708627 /ORGANISM="Timspurckia oligopyrenoides, Strain CCMP3278" /LENGTH=220 /DNA_ID=CAMNT_0024647811 /DNA_START=609 /DNA_END=1271 /DNA_ORIENTATION=-